MWGELCSEIKKNPLTFRLVHKKHRVYDLSDFRKLSSVNVKQVYTIRKQWDVCVLVTHTE